MQPSRIIAGEVRSEECLDQLLALKWVCPACPRCRPTSPASSGEDAPLELLASKIQVTSDAGLEAVEPPTNDNRPSRNG